MSAKRLYVVIMALAIGYQQAGIGQDKPTLPANDTIADAELDKQLKINREALLKGSSEQMRIDSATVLLFNEDPRARRILLDALKQSENSVARAAICKALSQSRAEQKTIKDPNNFIQPLFAMLPSEKVAEAKLAAEALLLFEYEQISESLEKMVSDSSLPVKARLNVVYALKLQPDKKAVIRLLRLVDDAEKQVAAAAEDALRSLRIPVGQNAETRRQIIYELERKGRDEFLGDWLIRLESQMRELEKELKSWQQLYLTALGTIYDGINEDAARGEFLVEHLGSSNAIVRLWALEKVSQWRKSTNPKLPAELGPVLVSLVSDQDKEVRLQTAKLLSLMVELNSAEKLLEQLNIEQDDEVRMELFGALGGACYYAFRSPTKISPEIRQQTLEWAGRYLDPNEQDAKKVQKGAEVMKKLLEQDGLAANDVGKYLGLLAERYEQEQNSSDGTLRGELLSAMASLCAQRSACRAESTKLFKPLFEKALRDETVLVREAAVSGLVYIDKAMALRMLRKDFVNAESMIIRKKLIDLAGEVGGQDDLVWLGEKVGAAGEGEPAWQAMLTIFKRSESAVLDEWMYKFDSGNGESKLSDEQKLSFLEIAELKAVGENKPKMVKAVREKQASLYSKTGEYERAAKYWGMVREVAQTEEKERILANLLDAYLRWPNAERAAKLVANCLLEKDLGANDVIVLTIDKYLASLPAGADIKGILGVLAQIKISQARPNWQEQLKRWNERIGPAKKPDS